MPTAASFPGYLSSVRPATAKTDHELDQEFEKMPVIGSNPRPFCH